MKATKSSLTKRRGVLGGRRDAPADRRAALDGVSADARPLRVDVEVPASTK